MTQYSSISIHGANNLQSQSIKDVAMETFSAKGIEDFVLDEAEIDRILGDRAFSGGNITDDLIAELETQLMHSTDFKIYFSDLKLAEKFLDWMKVQHAEVKTVLEEVESKDWNEDWKKHYHQIIVTPELTIIPSWEKQGAIKNNELYIYPGRGFGTGTHETTFQCLKLFMEMPELQKKITCLDYGCGSGILGINFIRLSPTGNCVLYDIDEQALENCHQNIELNELSEKSFLVSARKKEFSGNQYEVVFANILLGILLEEQNDIIGSLKSEGTLIVSGLLEGQGDELIRNFIDGTHLQLIKRSLQNGWEAIVFQKL